MTDSFKITSQTRLFPQNPTKSQHDIPLSLLDNTVANFAPTAGVWVYPSTPPLDDLIHALRTTLSIYPQWTGHLCECPSSDPAYFGRLQLSYGYESDPGIELTISTSATDLGAAPPTSLIPSTPLANGLENVDERRPCMAIQLTTTSSSSAVAIGVKMTHAIADAQTLVTFLRSWAAAAATDNPNTALTPVKFDPSLLSLAARPNSTLADSLPLLHYDWWASGRPPPAGIEFQPGRAMPWDTWDTAAPVRSAWLRFSGADLADLHAAASSSATETRISHLDALLAHLWGAINCARNLAADSALVHLCCTLGLRGRIPCAELGSPILLSAVSTTGAAASKGGSEIAAKIRKTVALFTPEAMGAVLHEVSQEVSPQRRWDAFCGTRHVIVTSWLRLGAYEIVFGSRPSKVQAVMPAVDGCVQIIETEKARVGMKWWEGGVDVQVMLEAEAMGRLMEDITLVGRGSGGFRVVDVSIKSL